MSTYKYLYILIKTGLLSLFLVIQSCHQTQDLPKKVIVIHARGVTYPDMLEYLEKSNSKVFFKAQEELGHLRKLTPITNAVTISNIATFETGEPPAGHGIVGHNFALKDNRTIKAIGGFAQRFDKESFWEQADKNGKQVLSIGALVLHGKYEEHTNVDCLAQGEQKSGGKLLKLIPSSDNQNDAILKFKDLEDNYTFALLNGSSDSILVYQTSASEEFILDADYNIDNGFLGKLQKGAWIELENNSDNNLKEAFRIKCLPAQGDTLDLYVRGSFMNRGYPQAFLEEVDSQVGSSKGWPNISLYARQGISDGTLVEEMHAETDYLMDVFFYARQRKNYDLMIIDYPILDRLGHAFLGLKASSPAIQQYYFTAFQRMDEDFNNIANFAQENGYELIITSGHGFSAIHTSIDVNNFLEKNEINTNLEDADWEAIGVPGKVSSHIYLNEQLSAEDKASVLNKIEKAFEEFTYPKNEQVIVEKVYKKNELSEIGLNHPSAGDVYVLLKPGFVFANGRLEGNQIFGKPLFKGDHGYSLDYEESFGVYIASEPCEPCQSTDIAQMIQKRLELD